MASILSAAATMVACDTKDIDRAIPVQQAITYSYPWHGAVREFRLRDGTRCVTYGQNSITCDWRSH